MEVVVLAAAVAVVVVAAEAEVIVAVAVLELITDYWMSSTPPAHSHHEITKMTIVVVDLGIKIECALLKLV